MTTVKEQEGPISQASPAWRAALNANAPAWLPKLRHAAIESFAELGFPTTHDEEWIYTNVSALASTPFVPARIKLTDELRKRRSRACRWPTWVAPPDVCKRPLRARTLPLKDIAPGSEGLQPHLRVEE